MKKIVLIFLVQLIYQKKDADDELEKEKFTEEEFEKACEDLGLEDCGEETDNVDDFVQQLNKV